MESLNWKLDFKASKFIIENTHLINGFNYKHYSKIYNNSDLNHQELFKKIKNGTNSYLGVAASTDPMLNAISLGFKNIHVFDINCLNIHYMFLKIAAILELEYLEYLDFFYSLDEDKYFAKTYFEKMKVELPNASLNYWKNLYEIYNSTEFSKLFCTGKYDIDDYMINQKVNIPSNIFLNEIEFYELKNKLKQINLHYYIEDLGDIPELKHF